MAPSPLIVDGNFPQCFLRNLREYRDLHFLCDCILRIETPQSVLNVDSDNHTDEIYAHRLVLAATSNFFKEIFLLKKDQKDSMTTVTLKLHSPDAVNCFKVILGFLYSGELHLKDCDPNHVFQVAKVCQITALEEQLRPPSPPKIPKQQPQQISSPTKSESNGRLNDNSPTPPARLNIFCADHKQMCCPCRNTSDGSLSSPYEARSMASFSPTSNAMAYVPVQSSMVSMVSTPSAVTLPTITAAEIRSNMIHHGYYGPLLPTTSNFLPTTPQSAPAFPSPGHQGFHPMMRFPLNGPQSMLSPSTPNSPLNGHPPRPLEGLMDQQQPSPRKVTAKRGTNAKLTQRPSPPDAPFDNLGDVIIPSSEKEGWCRNKKYIERVPSGFMCTVCRKVYGRYNSVSYHVTIYHRNPPIKCDEPGCQFTTREARYIHFHKYYRHHIALPESIDLGSRKCPFCRHVSKSPAMLEKHINRHMPECNRVGRMYQCQQCPKQLSSQRAMYDHMLTHNEDKNYPCDQCNYKGRTESNLAQHVMFKHSSEMFKQKKRCQIDDCNFTCASFESMQEHKVRVHGKIDAADVNSEHHLNHEEEDDDAMLVHSDDDDELIDVDGESSTASVTSDAIHSTTPPPESSASGHSDLVVPATPPPSFSSIVDNNANITPVGREPKIQLGSTPKLPLGRTGKQGGYSANSSSTSLEDDHSQLAAYSAENEPIVTRDYGIV